MFTTPDFTIFPLENNEFDVFTGQGWKNWSRFRKEYKHLKLVKGAPLTKELYETLTKELWNY